MGVGYNPKIVTNGLIMCVDAANSKSYPGSGSTWFDISGNGNNLTLTGSPTFTSGVARFNGTSQYAQNNLNLSTSSSTIIAGSRYTSGTNGRVVTSTSNNWLLGHWSASVANYYAEGWITSAGAGGNDTSWRIYAGTNDVAGDFYNLYINGTLNAGNANGAAGPNGISVGRWAANNSEYSSCEVSFILVYNRILTAEEIQQNYNALRGRFSL